MSKALSLWCMLLCAPVIAIAQDYYVVSSRTHCYDEYSVVGGDVVFDANPIKHPKTIINHGDELTLKLKNVSPCDGGLFYTGDIIYSIHRLEWDGDFVSTDVRNCTLSCTILPSEEILVNTGTAGANI